MMLMIYLKKQLNPIYLASSQAQKDAVTENRDKKGTSIKINKASNVLICIYKM